MWDGLDDLATNQALDYRARNPTPPPPPRVSGWSQVGEILASPFKGVGQGALQTARNVNAAAGVAGVSAIDPREDLEGYLEEQALSREGATVADPLLRRGIDRLKPDAQASTIASLVLQDAFRLATKAAGYYAAGGTAAAVAGTAADEGLTGFRELRDKGVDPQTAASVGAVRAATTGVGMAIPVAGSTVLRSVALGSVGGPGSFMAEQAITRDILERAKYPELAAEHDPFDPVGLGVSILVPAAFGGAVHLGRSRVARRAEGEAAPEVHPVEALADTPEVRDAAHVAFQSQAVDVAMLGNRADPQVRATHVQALDDAARAMDAGEPVRVSTLEVDPVKAQRVAEEVGARLRAVDAELGALRLADIDASPTALLGDSPLTDPAAGMPGATPGPLQAIVDQVRQVLGIEPRARPSEAPSEQSPAMQRAQRIVDERPELPVRMDDDGSPARPAGELLAAERQRNRAERDEAQSAYAAAIECFLQVGQ